MRAFIVLDLGFGDAGKGLLTDYLVRRNGAGLVVRYNGGAQAGHNVVAPDGRHHTFAQIGSGSFVPGVRTFLSRHVVVNPTALRLEAGVLRGRGAGDALTRLRISEGARLVTPFHQALGRLRELARGAGRHGSCGAGIGETVRDALGHPADAVRAGDLRHPAALRRKLAGVRERLAAEAAEAAAAATVQAAASGGRAPEAERELAVFADGELAERWIAAALPVAGQVSGDEILRRWLAEELRPVVFEGAQGVLLDEWRGFHPYTTWSDCTAANALELLAESGAADAADAELVGVLRSYAVRHGPGPLPTETGVLRAAVREHNRAGAWQGPVRYGWFDAVLARYALDAAGPVHRLAVTHLDVPARLGRWQLAVSYQAAGGLGGGAGAGDGDTAGGCPIERLTLGERCDLAHQERLTALLGAAAPVYVRCASSAQAAAEAIEQSLGRRIDYLASGPGAADVRATSARPGRDADGRGGR